MLVGEQPGDHEDIAGKRFVGPAGRVLDHALKEAGTARGEIFLSIDEIDRCRWWPIERRPERPGVIVAMGATAVRGVFGRSAGIATLRGRPQFLTDGTAVLVTTHPSFLLRLGDETDKQLESRKFVADLRVAAGLPGAAG